MSALRVDASIQGDRSASSALADIIEREILAAGPDESFMRRHLGTDPLPAEAWPAAVTAAFIDRADRDDQQRWALALARSLAAELTEADAAVLALPLYNWGVSQHVKTWIDLAISGAAPGTRLLDGTPVVLVTTRGGAYGPGTPRAGWDHSTAYLRRILADVWGADLTVIERELTLVGINPALDQFAELAEASERQAEAAAATAGQLLAARLGRRADAA